MHDSKIRFYLLSVAALVPLLIITGTVAADPPSTRQASRDGDVDIAAKIAAADGDHGDAAYIVVYESTDVRVAPDGMGSNLHTRVIKILTAAGLKSQTTRRWQFQPETNEVALDSIRIHRADGSIESVGVSSAVIQPAPAGIIFWGGLQMIVDVPGVRVGDSIVVVHRKRGFNVAYLANEGGGQFGSAHLEPPMPGHWYDNVTWGEGVPVLEKRYSVSVPKDKPLQYEVVNGELKSSITFNGDRITYAFEKKDIPAFKSESKMVSRSDVICKLVLATLEDWHAKARWFYEANEPSFELTDEIRETTNNVIEGLTDDEGKWTALNHWVAENIRYVGSSRGACEGFTTHASAETLRDRGGVCKDKAGMLVSMLRAAGYESYIVMTMAGSRVEETPADQFNHAVTCVRTSTGEMRLLDPTWMPKSREMWSTAEQLQTVVFGTPDGKLGKQLTPYSPPEDNVATWRSRCRLLPEGALRGTVQISTLGCPETTFRRALSRFRPEDRWGRIEESISKLSADVVLESYKATDPVDFTGPASLTVDFESPAYSVQTQDGHLVRLPSLSGFLEDLIIPDVRGSRTVPVKDRKYPVRIRATRRLDCLETIELPDGHIARNLPEAVEIDGPAASIKFDITCKPGQIRYECRLDLKKHKVPVSDYANFKAVVDAFVELGKQTVLVERGEQRVRR